MRAAERALAIDGVAEACRAQGLLWDPAWSAPLQALLAQVADGQTRVNLVGDPSPAGVAEHVLEALVLATAAQQQLGRAPLTVVDVGAGAGIVALTLASCWRGARVVAVEPRKLRAQFIAEAAQALDLGNLQTVAASLHSAHLTAEFELATARAVWPAPEWLPRAWPLLAAPGLAAVHGKGPPEALATLLRPLGRTVQVLAVPGPRGHAVALLRPPKG